MHADPKCLLSADVLARYRPYLVALARQTWPARLRARLAPSDVVQKTLFEAHQNQSRFRGEDERALRAWLRAILANNLRDVFKAQGPGKRNVARERALQDMLDTVSMRLESCLAAQEPSPRSNVLVHEALLRMAAALEKLPPAQRMAIELHHLQCNTITADISGEVTISAPFMPSSPCALDLHREMDPATGRLSTTGTACGLSISLDL